MHERTQLLCHVKVLDDCCEYSVHGSVHYMIQMTLLQKVLQAQTFEYELGDVE